MVVNWSPADVRAKANVRAGVYAADTLEELARIAGIDAAGLLATVERYNGFVADGADPDFGRTLPARRRSRQPPFYAMRNHGIALISFAGLDCDAELRIRREDGAVVLEPLRHRRGHRLAPGARLLVPVRHDGDARDRLRPPARPAPAPTTVRRIALEHDRSRTRRGLRSASSERSAGPAPARTQPSPRRRPTSRAGRRPRRRRPTTYAPRLPAIRPGTPAEATITTRVAEPVVARAARIVTARDRRAPTRRRRRPRPTRPVTVDQRRRTSEASQHAEETVRPASGTCACRRHVSIMSSTGPSHAPTTAPG